MTTCPNCGKVAGLHSSILQGCMCQYSMQAPPQRTEQEPVTLPCCGYRDASAVKWNPLNDVVQCHNCGQTYALPQRTWQGLTTDEIAVLHANYPNPQGFALALQAKLKEKNGA